jgi:hypothetical protein
MLNVKYLLPSMVEQCDVNIKLLLTTKVKRLMLTLKMY